MNQSILIYGPIHKARNNYRLITAAWYLPDFYITYIERLVRTAAQDNHEVVLVNNTKGIWTVLQFGQVNGSVSPAGLR